MKILKINCLILFIFLVNIALVAGGEWVIDLNYLKKMHKSQIGERINWSENMCELYQIPTYADNLNIPTINKSDNLSTRFTLTNTKNYTQIFLDRCFSFVTSNFSNGADLTVCTLNISTNFDRVDSECTGNNKERCIRALKDAHICIKSNEKVNFPTTDQYNADSIFEILLNGINIYHKYLPSTLFDALIIYPVPPNTSPTKIEYYTAYPKDINIYTGLNKIRLLNYNNEVDIKIILPSGAYVWYSSIPYSEEEHDNSLELKWSAKSLIRPLELEYGNPIQYIYNSNQINEWVNRYFNLTVILFTIYLGILTSESSINRIRRKWLIVIWGVITFVFYISPTYLQYLLPYHITDKSEFFFLSHFFGSYFENLSFWFFSFFFFSVLVEIIFKKLAK